MISCKERKSSSPSHHPHLISCLKYYESTRLPCIDLTARKDDMMLSNSLKRQSVSSVVYDTLEKENY
ncbi:hypothetical protein JOD24_003379 [Kroppenstedtia sanguinis]